MDVWSRRIVGWRIAHRDSPRIAAELITDACRQGKLDPKGLVLHSDNGKPMRASTLLATTRSVNTLCLKPPVSSILEDLQ